MFSNSPELSSRSSRPSISVLMGTLLMLGAVGASGQSDDDGASVVAAASGVPTAAGARQAGWQGQWGIGLLVNPDFVGSEDYSLIPLPYLDFRYLDERGTKFFANVPQGLGGYAYRWRRPQSGAFLNIGGALAPGFNVRDDSIDGLEEIDPAIEARLYLEAGGRNWTAQVTAAQDVGSGHEGAYLDLSVAWRDRIGDRGGFYAVGPVLRLGDDDYKNTLFGVTAAESEVSGLSAYEAEGGIERAGVQGVLSLPVGNSRWRWTGIIRASQLLDDASDSPITETDGQFFFLTAITRSF